METNPYQSPSEPETRPAWVRLTLWGVPSRRTARGWFWLSVALALGGSAFGFVDRRFFGCSAFLIGAYWYWSALRWVDNHGGWSGV